MSDNGPNRNRRTALSLSLLVLGMFAFGFAMVPLYGLICQVTGIQSASVPVRAPGPAAAAGDGRLVRVKFDATVNDRLPWEFEPAVREMVVPVGEMAQMSYRARNRANAPVTGQAVPAVVPWQATPYFSKTECFCFRRQTLEPGESREMPLAFVVTADLPEGIDTLTLSYSFMNAEPLAPGNGH
jgi:cytochrome c oxidase assembly protein subunit 11